MSLHFCSGKSPLPSQPAARQARPVNRKRRALIRTAFERLEDRTVPSAGGLDVSFGTGGKVVTDFGDVDAARATLIQPDGKIVAVGSAFIGGDSDFAIARYNVDGTLDQSFGIQGKVIVDLAPGSDDTAHAVVVQPDGKIVVVGSANAAFAVIRLTVNGALDPTFGTSGIVATDFAADGGDGASSVVLQADGKIIAAGTSAPDVSNIGNAFSGDFALARYNSDGSLDATFGIGGKVITDLGRAEFIAEVAIQADGRIVAAGTFNSGATTNLSSEFGLVRYNSNGSLDTTFGTGGRVTAFGGYSFAGGVAIQDDGRIVVVGHGQLFGGATEPLALARYNSDGSLDTTFGTDGKVTTGFSAKGFNSVAIQADGKIVATGSYTEEGLEKGFLVVRYQVNGDLDLTFGTGGRVIVHFVDAADAHAVTIARDGKIVVAGSGDGDFALVRLLAGPPIVEFFALADTTGRVQVRHTDDGSLRIEFTPFGINYEGAVSIAWGDVDQDGYRDLVTGAAFGNPHVKVYRGRAIAFGTFEALNPDASVIADFFAYGLGNNIGAHVAVGDVNGDGYADIVTGTTGGNPHVRVFSGKDIAVGTFDPDGASRLADWFAYSLNSNLGTFVAVGDTNSDGFADVITGASAGNPHIRIYSGKDIATADFDPASKSILQEWMAFDEGANLGAHVAVGDVNADGTLEVIAGATITSPRVRVFQPNDIYAQRGNALYLSEFFAYDPKFGVGVSVGAADMNGDGHAEILTGAAQGAPHFRIVDGGASGIKPPALTEGIPNDIQRGILVAI